MADTWIDPTPEQEAQAERAKLALIETINAEIRTGTDPRVVLLALGNAACDMLTSVFGATAVAPWFDRQAEVVRQLQGPAGGRTVQ